MKHLRTLTLLAAGSALAFGQSSVTANGTAKAKVLQKIVFTPAPDPTGGASIGNAILDFGSMVATTNAGTVTVSTAIDGSNNVTSSRASVDVDLVGTAFSAACWDLAGTAGAQFQVNLPAVASTLSSGLNTMTVDTWNHKQPLAFSGTGTAKILVGGVLHVGVSQPAGDYSGNFTVTVAYK